MVDIRPTVSLAGSSGVSYTYWVFPINWIGSKEPGNYVLAKLAEPSGWAIVYVGETENINDRLGDKEAIKNYALWANTCLGPCEWQHSKQVLGGT